MDKRKNKSKEWRQNISKAMHNLSTEVKKRKALAVSKAQKGRVSQWRGKKLPWKNGNKGKKLLYMIGKNNPNWKGGISSQSYKDRRKFQRTIQKQVFKRDNYTCQICEIKGGDLQVDHIQNWADYVELRFNIENCRTLCVKCHYKITFGRPMPPTVRAWGHNITKGGKFL